MKRHTRCGCPTAYTRTLLLATAVCLVAGGMSVAARADDVNDPLRAMMEDTGLKYKIIDEHSYLVPFELDDEGTLDVFVTYNNEDKKFVLVFCTILDYEDGHQFRPETMARALKLNNDYPAVKLCLDVDNGDIDCQAEAYVRTLDADALDMYINFVASMAVKFFEELYTLEEPEAVG